MPSTRTLRLAREALTELGSSELRHVAGGTSVTDRCLTPRVCYATREEGGCHWAPSFSPWECLTLSPCP
jgi:hypothetical protein